MLPDQPRAGGMGRRGAHEKLPMDGDTGAADGRPASPWHQAAEAAALQSRRHSRQRRAGLVEKRLRVRRLREQRQAAVERCQRHWASAEVSARRASVASIAGRPREPATKASPTRQRRQGSSRVSAACQGQSRQHRPLPRRRRPLGQQARPRNGSPVPREAGRGVRPLVLSAGRNRARSVLRQRNRDGCRRAVRSELNWDRFAAVAGRAYGEAYSGGL